MGCRRCSETRQAVSRSIQAVGSLKFRTAASEARKAAEQVSAKMGEDAARVLAMLGRKR